MRELTVEFDGRQVSLVEDVAILVVTTATESGLPFARGQPMRSLDVPVIPQLQNRMQSGRVQCEQLRKLRPPAHLWSQLEVVGKTCLRRQPALEAADNPAACVVQRPGGVR
ncbi:MAG TPA: hypothetical protein VMA32_16955 [Streptosporangiaceae bacterium]|nr:hypothetical protein [Streptosporangiaceae bacterium]